VAEEQPQTEPPRDFEALRQFIVERWATLPKRLAQVAEYALKNPDDVAFGTAASIAQEADVQPSTLVRFAHQLGYEGFSDLQTVFRARLLDRTSSYEDRLKSIEAATGDASEESILLNGFLNAARQSVDQLANNIDVESFRRAVTILAGAETIYLLAKRRSYPLIAHMAYACGKLKIRSAIVGSPNGIDPEIAALATPNDAAIAISFSPYAADTVAQARTMVENGVPLVAITDSTFSPLASLASEWIEIAEADYVGFRSLAASMAVTMALPVAVAEKRRARPLRPTGILRIR
jgi:DNA-binding MurR/RpiR family transcriptional regulator